MNEVEHKHRSALIAGILRPYNDRARRELLISVFALLDVPTPKEKRARALAKVNQVIAEIKARKPKRR